MLDHLHTIGDELVEAATYIFASMAFKRYTKREPEWFTRRKENMQDSLQDVPIVQEWIGWGRQEEREKQIKDESQTLLVIVQGRFPNLLSLAKQFASQVSDPAQLLAVMAKVSLAQNSQQATQALAELAPKQQS